VQERLQLFVGRQGASALALAEPPAAAAAAGPAAAGRSAAPAVWDAARRLGIPVAYSDLVSEPKVFLDALLPRAAALAETCPDTAVRVAASELLHAAVLYIVGANARQPRDQGAPRPLAAAATPLAACTAAALCPPRLGCSCRAALQVDTPVVRLPPGRVPAGSCFSCPPLPPPQPARTLTRRRRPSTACCAR
jgi:hypothetical protein